MTQHSLSYGRINIDSKHGKNKDTSLHKATFHGNFKICEMLLRHGATINSSNASNTTPLHLAIAGGNVDVFTLLLDSGADLNRRNNYGLTSLHIAAGCGNLQLCRILLKDYSLDLHAKDNRGKTPLHVCAHSHSCGSFQFLVEMGSDVHLKTKTGGTLFTHCSRSWRFRTLQNATEKPIFQCPHDRSSRRITTAFLCSEREQ